MVAETRDSAGPQLDSVLQDMELAWDCLGRAVPLGLVGDETSLHGVCEIVEKVDSRLACSGPLLLPKMHKQPLYCVGLTPNGVASLGQIEPADHLVTPRGSSFSEPKLLV